MNSVIEFGEVDLTGKRIAAHTNPMFRETYADLPKSPCTYIFDRRYGVCYHTCECPDACMVSPLNFYLVACEYALLVTFERIAQA